MKPSDDNPRDRPATKNRQDDSQIDIDMIAEMFSQAMREGQQPSIEDYLERYPQHSETLKSLLGSIEMIEGLKKSTSDDRETLQSQSKIEQLDDYKIVREIGRGGMGVVFEAIHESLGRRVAVKVLASGLLGSPKHLARFRREAQAAAKLRHPNIVPVFGVGSSHAHHYYVMDFIDGVSLHQWLDSLADRRLQEAPTFDESAEDTTSGIQLYHSNAEVERFKEHNRLPQTYGTPDYYRWVANLGATTASALQYAHTQGVLHRDIKPANLLIDGDGDVWVADFGLAKLAEQQSVTMTGDIVGTPQYMPPESFEGTYDAKSEVYALGLTLYELLTMRPAIEGNGTPDIIRKASQGVSVSPRKSQPDIPHDLETIVLKALALDPRSRYVSAGEIRDDLQRFLSDRPISARRSSSFERLIRWSRREPTVAILTIATFLLLFALAAVSAVGFFRTTNALAQANAANQVASDSLKERTAALEVADEEKVRAERNLQVAVAAFDEVMENISQRGIEVGAEFLGEVTDTTSPNVNPADAELLNSLLGFFDDLASNNSDDLLEQSAVAARRAGDIMLRLGRLEDAEDSFREALDRTQKLSRREPEDVRHVIAQAEIMNELAVTAGLRGRLGVSDSSYDQAKALMEKTPAAMATAAGKFTYARAYRLYGSHATRTGLDDLIQSKPMGMRPARRPLPALLRLRTNDALAALDRSIDVLNELLTQYPENKQYQAELARSYRDKATVASKLRMRSDAETSVRRSIELFDELLLANPTLDAIRYELALTLSSSEALSFNQMLRANRANELSSELLKESPDLPRYRALRAHTLEALAAQQQRGDRMESAERNLGEALSIYNKLVLESPELVVYQRRRSQVLESMAELKIRQGEDEEAIEYLERAVRRLSPSLRRKNVSPLVRLQIQRLNQKLLRIRDDQ
ncbi:MAG: protein kinase domain-containing protein [Rubripirellula sp.]